jgi:hypothetical protein
MAAVVAVGMAPAPAPGQEDLGAAALRLTAAWSGGDVASLAALMRPEGIGLHLPGRSSPALGTRQARAALADFLEEAGPGTATLTRVEDLGGTPGQGFAELAWSAAAGPSARGPYTVFVGFFVTDGAWRIAEIRIFSGTVSRPWP